MKKNISVCLLLFVSLLFASCATTGNVNKNANSVETVILKIPNIATPQWVLNDSDFWAEENGTLNFRGIADNMSGLASAKEVASNNAKSGIVSRIRSNMIAETESAIDASSSGEGQSVRAAYASATGAVTISGITVKSSYTEQIENTRNRTTFYRSYALVQINKEDYDKAVNRVYNKVLQEELVKNNAGAKKLAAEVKQRLLESMEK